jgi:hypothetical protein
MVAVSLEMMGGGAAEKGCVARHFATEEVSASLFMPSADGSGETGGVNSDLFQAF